MTDFLTRLVARTRGSAPTARPCLPSLFEPGAPLLSAATLPAGPPPPPPAPARRWESTREIPGAGVPPTPEAGGPRSSPALGRPARPPAAPVTSRYASSPPTAVAFPPSGERPPRPLPRTSPTPSIADTPRAAREPRPEPQAHRPAGLATRERAEAARTTSLDATRSTPIPRLEAPRGQTLESAFVGATEPVIHVSIGRIEVRAVAAPSRATPRASPPRTTLDEYLRRRLEDWK